MSMPSSVNGGTWNSKDVIGKAAANLKTNLDIPFSTYTPVLGTDTVAGQLVIDSATGTIYVVNAANNAYQFAANQLLRTIDTPTFAGLFIGTYQLQLLASNGQIEWGTGAAWDTYLYRSGVSTLTLTGSLVISSALTVNSNSNWVSSLTTESGAGITLTASNPTGIGAGYYTPSISGNLVIGSYGITFAAIADASLAGNLFLSSTTADTLKYYDIEGTPNLHQLAVLDIAQTFSAIQTMNGGLAGTHGQNIGTGDSPTFVNLNFTGVLEHNSLPYSFSLDKTTLRQYITWLDSNLVLYLPMDEGSGSTVYDKSGNGNNGTLKGSPLPSWVTGKFGDALSFAGSVAQYVSVPDSPTIRNAGSSTRSILLWAYFTSIPSVINNIFFGISSTGNKMILYFYGTSELRVSSGMSGGNGGADFNTGINPSNLLNGWHHIVFVEDGNYLNFYLDGAFISNSASSGTWANVATPFYIGWNSANMPTVDFDDVRIYNRALSASDVLSIYQNGALPIPETLINQAVTIGSSPTFVNVTLTGYLNSANYLTGAYGAAWGSLPSFPFTTNGGFMILWNTDTSTGRIYAYASGGWHYSALT